jgi:hypothetical protein
LNLEFGPLEKLIDVDCNCDFFFISPNSEFGQTHSPIKQESSFSSVLDNPKTNLTKNILCCEYISNKIIEWIWFLTEEIHQLLLFCFSFKVLILQVRDNVCCCNKCSGLIYFQIAKIFNLIVLIISPFFLFLFDSIQSIFKTNFHLLLQFSQMTSLKKIPTRLISQFWNWSIISMRTPFVLNLLKKSFLRFLWIY